jgi:putative DNA primase/helicase
MTSPEAIKEAVREAWRARLAMAPPRQDGSKAPEGFWKVYQRRLPTVAELRGWYADGRRTGLGIVCGAVSGNVECLEFDEASIYQAFLDAARWAGLTDLVALIRAGFEEASAGGGIHWLYFCSTIAGNTTLASRPTIEAERRHPRDLLKVTIQTRGEGGYVVTSPSYGAVHPTGRPYRLLSGGFGSIVTIAPEEREHLFRLARLLDKTPRPEPRPGRQHGPGGERRGTRPGDDFNARGDWRRDILEPAGWRYQFTDAEGREYYLRPGKDRGVSADVLGNALFVFTSSSPLPPDRAHSRFAAFAHLFYNGDFAAASAALARRGYGGEPVAPQRLPAGAGRRRHG